MPQQWLYQPVQFLMSALSGLTAFQVLMSAADATEARARCRFLQTETDSQGNESVLIPGAICGMKDGLTRTRSSNSDWRTSAIELWSVIQAYVPSDFADELEAAFPGAFDTVAATPADWFVWRMQQLIDQVELYGISYSGQSLDIRSIRVEVYPVPSRTEYSSGTGADRDYWWCVLEFGVGS